MEKLLKRSLSLCLAAIGLILPFTSCQKDVSENLDTENTVVFSTELSSGLQTRSFGDGSSANKLTYVVYKSGEKDIVTEGTTDISSKSATISLSLVSGTYDIVFWAQSSSCSSLAFDENKQQVTIDYTGAKANDELMDAFFHVEKALAVNGLISKEISLKRPFAQLNIGTKGLDANNDLGGSLQTKVVVRNVANTLNLMDGTVSNEEEVTFELANIPSGETFPVSGYDYLLMNYLLVGETESTIECDFSCKGASDGLSRTFYSVPVQRNYRTNIYGNLLSNAGDFNVSISPDFGGDHNNQVWSGETTAITPNQDTYTVTTAAELAWIAEQVNDGTNNFSGKSIVLNRDIDLANYPWTPIGTSSNSFQGTFDGNGKTIYNLRVNQQKDRTNSAGLFGVLNGTVENLNVKNAVIESITIDAAGCAVIAGKIYPAGTVESVTVTNAEIYGNHYLGGIAGYAYVNKISSCIVSDVILKATPDKQSSGKYDNGDKVGGIVGFLGEGACTIVNCEVSDFSITGYRDLGGIVGIVYGENVISSNKVKKGTITVDQTTNFYEPKDSYPGAIWGRGTPDAASSTGNTEENVTINDPTNL